ncbi:MAG: hypothetical protein UR26_C0003G0152 [candidate division TM6 bacterium GW2011_GWF2_32_72]|nr:MAG: hypothetical protein UR26_C0003G0152 [candidate division TM6 bacterium GW2011_GWF2_32_72]
MNILQAWGDSLRIFQSTAFKIYFFSSLKTAWSTMLFWLKYFGWILVAGILLQYASYTTSFSELSLIYSIIYLFIVFAALFFLNLAMFGIFLVARPSVKKKDTVYLRLYWRQFFIFLVVIFGVLGLANLLEAYGMGVVPQWVSFFIVFWFLVIFFFLDSAGALKDFFICLYRGLKMFLYNLPIIMIMTSLWFFIKYILDLIAAYFRLDGIFWEVFYQLIEIFILLVFISFAVTFYTKRVYEQQKLYLK